MKNTHYLYLKITAIIGFLAMIYVNYLANALPIGGVTPGEASDAYANLFTPAGITFSIWGLIYLLLGAYVIFQFFYPKNKQNDKSEKLLAEVNKYFILITDFINFMVALNASKLGIILDKTPRRSLFNAYSQ